MRDSSADHTFVSHTVEAELIGSDDLTTLLGAELQYHPSDPYAATMVLSTPTGPVVWVFGRDLLIDGLGEPTGDGDVHVWPSLDTNGRAVVLIELCSPEGAALVQLRSGDLARFTDRVVALVAPGSESAHVDVDASIAALLPTP
ncbi:SsgA family sporulation/cell division regulator [Nocardioides panacis]|uniref:SsgA family sporulation/cell division regulator n=1 Tax=Nocardioides panacis TaxID=2849501 RepID=A0A975Y037_9ACTN|nr:SsgA family sporulation/cell division regulator [Nocardioides panacis]QWZ08063.1 SsgA family sporulation/cell division regulator [Nocardioides panacis]